MHLSESSVVFSGDPAQPALDLQGRCKVGATEIIATLRGTLRKPDLTLRSEPPRPKELLLYMLATGDSWEGAEIALSEGKIPVDVARDLIDHLFFGGRGRKVAAFLGIKNVSLTYIKGTQGIEVKKAITDKLSVRYGFTPAQAAAVSSSPTQTVGGEYSVTKSLSVGAEREVTQQDAASASGTDTPPADKVYLKFEKQF
jgi:autotransporter translocation and assembly factor TamB